MLNGQPYTEKNAADFIQWVQEGWKNKSHFVFFIREKTGEIIGAMDIKSANLNKAEIGYWADENHKGFMTNAVKELLSLAKTTGFQSLFARTAKGNSKSSSVLERAGFSKIEEKENSESEYEKRLV